MDEEALYISEKLASQLAVIARNDEDILTEEALDAIIDDDGIDLGQFLEFVSQLCPKEREIAQYFIGALESRLYARIVKSADAVKLAKKEIMHSVSGLVKWYDESRGFAFIVSNDKALDVLVNSAMIQRSNIKVLEAGQPVEFDVEKTADGNLTVRRLLLEKM